MNPSASALVISSSTKREHVVGIELAAPKVDLLRRAQPQRATVERAAGVDAGVRERAQQRVALVEIGDVHAALSARQALGDEGDDRVGLLVDVVVGQAEVVAVAEAAEVARQVFDHEGPCESAEVETPHSISFSALISSARRSGSESRIWISRIGHGGGLAHAYGEVAAPGGQRPQIAASAPTSSGVIPIVVLPLFINDDARMR